MLAGTPWYPLCPWPCHSIAVCVCWSGALQESLAEQLEEGSRQSIWLPQRGRLQAQAEGGFAARLELTTHVEKGLYALFASGDGCFDCRREEAWLEALLQAAAAGGQAACGMAWASSSWRCWAGWLQAAASCLLLQLAVFAPLHSSSPCVCLERAESEVYLCQETSWGWLKKIGASSTAGQTRLRARRGYEQPVSKVGLARPRPGILTVHWRCQGGGVIIPLSHMRNVHAA